MDFKLASLDDKIEFFEAYSITDLEKKINEKVDQNQAILLEVHHVSHHVHLEQKTERPVYSAVVHFKAKK